MKFGLRNVRFLLKAVGNPQRRFTSIHVGGTNGKGSTAAFLASISMEAGYTTGLYTSPHLIRFTERIRINGHEIHESRLVEYAKLLKPHIEKTGATFFEATTCIAFMFFADERAELAVIEVGLGGRLDATNVLRPIVSVITNVSREHTEILGTTLPAIAREKGGIMKRGIPCITGSNDPVVLRTLRSIAKTKGTHLYTADTRVILQRQDRSGRSLVSLSGRKLRVRSATLGLDGEFQVQNARTAVAALDVCLSGRMNGKKIGRISGRSVTDGLRYVDSNTGIRGRLETFGVNRRFIIDVAHNPEAVLTLVEALQRNHLDNLIVVFGVMADKEYQLMVQSLAPVTATMITVQPRVNRALPLSRLIPVVKLAGIGVIRGRTVESGVRKALRLAARGQKILITGSHYVAGEAMEYLEKRFRP